MIPNWLIKFTIVVVWATIPLCAFYAFYYDNPVWLLPAAVALAIAAAG